MTDVQAGPDKDTLMDIYRRAMLIHRSDERFRARSEEELLTRRDHATLVMISHDPGTLRQYCRRGAVVYGGSLVFFDTVDEAAEVHHRLQMRGV